MTVRDLSNCNAIPSKSAVGYIATSVDLAHEYLKLGKIKRANAIYGQVLNAIRGGHLSDEICARFFLRYAEALAAVDNVLQR
jgi:separase